MRSLTGMVCFLGLIVSCVAGCGDDPANPSSTTAVFASRYLWKVGNCEVGTLTPVDPNTGEADLCGDAQEVSECADGRILKLTVQGMEATITASQSTLVPRMRFERTLNCEQDPLLEPDQCRRIESLMVEFEHLYFARPIDPPPTDNKGIGDALWLVMEKPWPGARACRAEFSR